MKKIAQEIESRQVPNLLTQLVLPLSMMMREELHQFVVSVGMQALLRMLEEDRTRLCGPRYRHHERTHRRNGSVPSELPFGGRKVKVRRPRVVDHEGREVELPVWEHFASSDAMGERMFEQMAIGVSTRKYKRSLEEISDDVQERGTSKSNVSRRFIDATTQALEAWQQRSLSELNLAAIFIDGIHFGEHVILLALGVDEEGKKHVIGMREGATENTEVCRSMIANMVERGLSTERSVLFVIDGGKGLRAAIRDTFGARGIVQRCQVHKTRNVLSHLPEKKHNEVSKQMRQAYRSRSSKTAKRLLENLAGTLEKAHPSAAASLREGLDESLIVLDFNMNESLTRTFATTNVIENLNERVRTTARRVKKWTGGEMILRWVTVGVLEAERGFRALKGKSDMPKLVKILRAKDAELRQKLAPKNEKVAA
jgi:putative transposase